MTIESGGAGAGRASQRLEMAFRIKP
jgi:hypothetical protein